MALPHAIAGIEIGGSKLQIFIAKSASTVIEKLRFQIRPDAGADGIRTQIEQSLRTIRKKWKLDAIGIGFGGPVDRKLGRVACSHQVSGWSEFPLRNWMSGLSGCGVVIENDANTAALAEAISGAGVKRNPVFYVTLGSGVGGGLVIDGQIYHGDTPGEAEIGHLRLNKKGTLVEEKCSGWAVDRKIRRAIGKNPRSVLARLARGAERGEARFLHEALQRRDKTAAKILDDTISDLAFGLSHVVHLFHPQVIVVGGGLSLVGEPLRAALEKRLPSFMMDVFQPGPGIRLAQLGEEVVPLGALHLAAHFIDHENLD